MNYLAHLYLSCNDEELMIGNYIADHIKNKEVQSYSTGIQKGIRLHRAIDSFTDSHPLVKQSSKRLHASQGKYAPVVVDILYDYLLATHWHRYHEDSLQDFSNGVYLVLQNNAHLFPAKLAIRTHSMIRHNWLYRYSLVEGLTFTLSKMDERARFPSQFHTAFHALQQNQSFFEEEFHAFFPELKNHVAEFCGC